MIRVQVVVTFESSLTTLMVKEVSVFLADDLRPINQKRKNNSPEEMLWNLPLFYVGYCGSTGFHLNEELFLLCWFCVVARTSEEKFTPEWRSRLT